jgi:hypothetical protein
VRALERAASIDLRFEPDDVELAAVDLSLAGYTNATGPEFARELIERARKLPHVQSATLAATLPVGSGVMTPVELSAPNTATPNGSQPVEAFWNSV